jgi:hypothetical protein
MSTIFLVTRPCQFTVLTLAMNIEDFDFFPSPFDLDDESELDNNQFWG